MQVNGVGKISACEFYAALGQALRNATESLGYLWNFSGETVLIEIPSRLRSHKTARGIKISIRRDYRVPKPDYWPNGVIPAGVKVFPDYKPSTGEILCDSPGYQTGRKNKAYLAWMEQHKNSPVYGIDGKPIRPD